MKFVHDWPPLIEEIVKVLPAARRETSIFAWGDRIYVPSGVQLPAQLVTHESVHGQQQLEHSHSIVGWWRQYLEDPAWRLTQEIPAHAAEHWAFCKKCADPNKRVLYLREVVAARLASPFYGSLLTREEAVRQIKQYANTGAPSGVKPKGEGDHGELRD